MHRTAGVLGLRFGERRNRLLKSARQEGFDALLMLSPQNIFYVTGFWGDAHAVLDEKGAAIFVHRLEGSRAQRDAVDSEVQVASSGSALITAVSERLLGLNICSDDSSFSAIDSLRRKVDGNLVTRPSLFLKARMIKDGDEVSRIREAARILDRLFEHSLEIVRPGTREMEIAGSILKEMLEMSALPPALDTTLCPVIVASGPNSALPHAEVSDRLLQEGDFVTVDITVRYRGYVADATRTFPVGSPSSEQIGVYSEVLAALEAGAAIAIPATPAGEVDRAVRSFITEHGHGKHFIHSTGHGVGLDIHEMPYLRPGESEPLARGMILTIEPGVYLPGRFGVRIEDTIYLGERPEVLTAFSKTLTL